MNRGFTLVEVLVALAIVSIALMAALRAAAQGTSAAGELRSRLVASWLAENRLAEHRARGDWLPLGIARGRQVQGGIEFAWREEVIGIAVLGDPSGEHPGAQLGCRVRSLAGYA